MPADQVTRANSIRTIRRAQSNPHTPSADTILGKFTAGENILKTANPNLSFQMMRSTWAARIAFSDCGGGPASAHKFALGAHIAVVVGSGEKGQVYLCWNEARLF